MSVNNKSKIFSNIANTNHNNINNNKEKTKQKSILDYFNRSTNNAIKTDSNQLKRSIHSSDNNVIKDKRLKFEEYKDISIIDEKIVSKIIKNNNNINNKSDLSLINEKISHKEIKESICNSNEELPEFEYFIDTNEYLEIDFHINDSEQQNSKTSVDNSLEDNQSKEDNYAIKGSYVYNNFRLMVDCVLNDEQYVYLFDSNDWKVIESFTSLTGLAQMLFMRLFLRKRDWIRKNAIKYPEIAVDLKPILRELIDNEFLINASHLDDLIESLNILDITEIKKVCRSLNGINMNGLTTKKTISAAIIKYINTCQPVLQNDSHSNSINEVVLKVIKTTLKDVCFKVNENICDVFERMFLLYCPPEISEDDYNKQLGFEFFKILKVEMGQEEYPKYSINRKAVIYKNRDDLISYAKAIKLENQILFAIERKTFDKVINNCIDRAKQFYCNQIKGNTDNRDSCLPPFLRRYTAGHTYIRCLSHCVKVLEQMKNHSEAVHILKEFLLSQTVYCEDYRGRWFERLALNLEKHLKTPKPALDVLEEGLTDQFVRTGHKYALYIRRKNLQKVLKISLPVMTEFESIIYTETVIFAETVKYSINDRKHIFKTTDSNGDVTVMPVEDIVLEHYKKNGFTDGLHTEGRVYHTLFGLLFWDIIYMNDTNDVCDAFRFNYQRLPLDFNSDEFFVRRKTQILSLLRALTELNESQINNILENSWDCNKGIASLVNWDNIDINQIKEIAMCFGPKTISGICERLIKDFRHTRSGFPDLLVWNHSNKQIKAVEVKGPNDRASTKQQLWLSFLKSLGVDVEICHVKVKKTI